MWKYGKYVPLWLHLFKIWEDMIPLEIPQMSLLWGDTVYHFIPVRANNFWFYNKWHANFFILYIYNGYHLEVFSNSFQQKIAEWE